MSYSEYSYREENIEVWNVINKNPKESKRFSIGKYDPANQKHVWILEQLNIDEKNLKSLEND